MAHEGRGNIDQEKKGRPGLQTGDSGFTTTPSRPHDLTTGWLLRAMMPFSLRCVTPLRLTEKEGEEEDDDEEVRGSERKHHPGRRWNECLSSVYPSRSNSSSPSIRPSACSARSP